MKDLTKVIYFLFVLPVFAFLPINISVADNISTGNSGNKSNCVFHPEIKSTFDYEWRLSGFTNKYISPAPIKVYIIVEREFRAPEIHNLTTPFNIRVHEEFSHISISKDKKEDLWHIALQQVKVGKCKDKKNSVVRELSSTEPLIVFKSYDTSSVKIIPAPDNTNIYNGNLDSGGLVDFRKSYKGSSIYTYQYKYCPDSVEELEIIEYEKKLSLKDIAKLSYCYIKRGEDFREKLFSRIKFPLNHVINHKISESKLNKQEFLKYNFCCGDVKPSLTQDGNSAKLYRDRHGNGEGEYLYFEFDKTKKKWYLTGIGIDSY